MIKHTQRPVSEYDAFPAIFVFTESYTHMKDAGETRVGALNEDDAWNTLKEFELIPRSMKYIKEKYTLIEIIHVIGFEVKRGKNNEAAPSQKDQP